jgi:hypothetical protein
MFPIVVASTEGRTTQESSRSPSHVFVVVRLCAARRNGADELGHRPAAGVRADDVAELPVLPRRVRGPVGQPDRRPPRRFDRRRLGLERKHGDEDELLRTGALDRIAPSRRDVCSGLRLERVLLPVEIERPRAGDDEENLLPRLAAARPRPSRPEAEDPLLEGLGARASADGHARGRRVAVELARLGLSLGGDVAAHIHISCRRRLPGVVGTAARSRYFERRLRPSVRIAAGCC